MLKFKFILLVLLLISIPVQGHKFYVSLIQIDFNEADQKLEFTFKIFSDDLENAVSVFSGKRFYLDNSMETDLADSLLSSYIFRNFKIWLNGSLYPMLFIGKEVELDVTWCYLEIPHITYLSEIRVSDEMLLELFEDQVNLINIKYKGVTSGMLLNRKTPKDIIWF